MAKYQMAVLSVDNIWIFRKFTIRGSRSNLNTLMVASLEFMPILESPKNLVGILLVQDAKRWHPIMLAYQDMETLRVDLRPCKEGDYTEINKTTASQLLKEQLEITEKNLCFL